MAFFIAILIIGSMFFLCCCVAWSFGFFGNDPTYDPEIAEDIAKKIFLRQALDKEIEAGLQKIPKENAFVRLFPIFGTRWHIKHKVTKLGGHL